MSVDEKRPLHLLPDWPAAMDARTAADYSGISRSLFDRERVVPARRIAGKLVYLRRDIDAYLNALPVADRPRPGAGPGKTDIDAGEAPTQARPLNRETQATPRKNPARWVQRLHDRQVQGP